MKMKKILALTLASAMIFGVFAGCGKKPTASGSESQSQTQDDGKAKIWTIGTADSSGTMYPVGAAVASVISNNVAGFKINVETSPGSPANCVSIQEKEVELATITADVAFKAVNGVDAFADNQCGDLRALCAVYASMSNWIALAESGLVMVNELGGKNIAIGPEASATEISGYAGLNAAGVTPGTVVNLGLGAGAEEVGDKVRDASHGFAGIPIGGQLSVAQTKPCTFLAFTDEELDKIIADNPSYYKTAIPAGTYPGQDSDVATFGVKCLVVVNADMDDETAYAFAEAISTHVSDLVAGHGSMKSMEDADFICNDIPIELHPGAAKYYSDAGMLK